MRWRIANAIHWVGRLVHSTAGLSVTQRFRTIIDDDGHPVQVRTIMINTDGHNHFIANIPTT